MMHSLSERTNLHAHSWQFNSPPMILQFVSSARIQDKFCVMNALLTDDNLQL
jgi:hypothetical protein